MGIPLKHLVGTATIMSLIIASGLSYSVFTSYIEAEVLRRQLNQVAEHVALNLVEVVSLVNFSNYSSVEPIFKVLKLPQDLGGRSYIIELVNETSRGGGCYVRARLATRGDVYASSPILLGQGSGLELKTEGEGTIDVQEGAGGTIQWSGKVYGGVEGFTVWGLMNGTRQEAGIGIWKREGG